MQRLKVSGAVRPIYGSLGVKRLKTCKFYCFLIQRLTQHQTPWMPKITVYIFGLKRNALRVKVNCWAILGLRAARAYQRGVRYLLIRSVTRPKKQLPAFYGTAAFPTLLTGQPNHDNAVHSVNPHFFKINFNITLPPMPVFPMTSLAFRLSD